MNRRAFLSSAILPALSVAGPRPNVLFLAVDDLRPELGCYGAAHIRSPNIDRLAARSLRFDRAYCQQAVCAPTRASLLTGARPDSTRVHDLQTPLNTVRPDLVSIPRHFRQNGYQTVSLGKIYHHANEDPQGWSAPPWRPDGSWSGGWRAYLDPLSRITVQQNDAAYPNQPARLGRGPAFESPDVADNAYPDGKIADRAIAELSRLRGQPFFLAAGFLKPHLPFNAPKRYWDLYDPASIQLPSRSTWPEDMPAWAGSEWGELRNYTGIPQSGPVDPATLRLLIHGYYACVSYTDAQVGRVLAELDRLGLRDNTIVVLWGDHGWKLGDYGAWCKHTNLESDTRVPLLLSLPGRTPAAAATSALVEYVDVYPTLAQAAGLPIPSHCEGSSLLPLFEDPQRSWKTAAFSQYPRGKDLMGYSVRSERYRYTEWIARPSGDVVARELYDHSVTATPSANLAGLPAHAATVREHSALLDRGQGWRKLQIR